MKLEQLLPTCIITLGIIIAVLIGANGIKHRNDGPRTITVKGMASKDFTSDLAIWDITVKVNASTPQQGFSALESNRDQVLSFLRSEGFGDAEIVSENVTYEELIDGYYDQDKQKYVRESFGYDVMQHITVTTSDVLKADKSSKSIGNLIAQGVQMTSHAPQYYYTQLSDLKQEMLAAASADARIRAQQIATESRGTLGSLRNAKMGVFQILGKYTNEDYSWGGTYNTSSIEKTASITVSSEFLVK